MGKKEGLLLTVECQVSNMEGVLESELMLEMSGSGKN